jgi:PAS domain S-box-containing protein
MLHAPVGMALVAMDGTFLEVNTALGAILGCEPATLVGTRYQDLLGGGSLGLDPTDVPTIDPQEDGASVVAVPFQRADGSEVEVDLHVAIVRSPGGTPLNAIVQVVDTTAARRAAAELRRANEELERFASVASHDLRSPLATTRGLLELLEHQLPISGDTSERDLLRRAERQLERLSATVDAVLELARATSEPLEVRDLDAATVLAEVTDSLDPVAERTGSMIELEADAVLTGDPRLLHSLLQNLVGNALRSTDDDRAVRVGVAASRDEHIWTLQVTDDGDGFPEHLRDRVFEPFAHHDRPGQPPGHGLGLAICERIVARHGGTIAVDHLERGTRVRILVPTNVPTDTGHGPDTER